MQRHIFPAQQTKGNCMNLQNIINFIDAEIKHADKHSAYYSNQLDQSQHKYWQGYSKAMSIVRSRIEKKIQDKREKRA